MLHLCKAAGRRSAEAAKAAGFAQVHSAEGDAHDLAGLLVRELTGAAAPLLYLAGAERSVDLGAELARHGLKTQTAVVYRAMAIERLSGDVEQALAAGELDGVLHYSRRSTETFVRCVAAGGLHTRPPALLHFCLSAQVAEPLIAVATNVRIAPRPDEESDVVASTEYGERFATIVGRGSIYGVQFHPEKSSAHGLTMLASFVALCAQRTNDATDPAVARA